MLKRSFFLYLLVILMGGTLTLGIGCPPPADDDDDTRTPGDADDCTALTVPTLVFPPDPAEVGEAAAAPGPAS